MPDQVIPRPARDGHPVRDLLADEEPDDGREEAVEGLAGHHPVVHLDEGLGQHRALGRGAELAPRDQRAELRRLRDRCRDDRPRDPEELADHPPRVAVVLSVLRVEIHAEPMQPGDDVVREREQREEHVLLAQRHAELVRRPAATVRDEVAQRRVQQANLLDRPDPATALFEAARSENKEDELRRLGGTVVEVVAHPAAEHERLDAFRRGVAPDQRRGREDEGHLEAVLAE